MWKKKIIKKKPKSKKKRKLILLVGRMNQNMILKEKWVYEEKVSSYKNGYNSYTSYM